MPLTAAQQKRLTELSAKQPYNPQTTQISSTPLPASTPVPPAKEDPGFFNNLIGGAANVFKYGANALGSAVGGVVKQAANLPGANVVPSLLGQPSIQQQGETIQKGIGATGERIASDIRGETPSVLTGQQAGVATNKDSFTYKAGDTLANVAAQVPGLVYGGEALGSMTGGLAAKADEGSRIAKTALGVAKSIGSTENSTLASRGEMATPTELAVYGAIDAATAGMSKLLGGGSKKSLQDATKKVYGKVASPSEEQYARSLFGGKTPGEIVAEINVPGVGPIASNNKDVLAKKILQSHEIIGKDIANTIKASNVDISSAPVFDAVSTYIAKEPEVRQKALKEAFGEVFDEYPALFKDTNKAFDFWSNLKGVEEDIPKRVFAGKIDPTKLGLQNEILQQISMNGRNLLKQSVPEVGEKMTQWSALQTAKATVIPEGTKELAGKGLKQEVRAADFSKTGIMNKIFEKAINPLLPAGIKQSTTAIQKRVLRRPIINKIQDILRPVIRGLGSELTKE